MGTGCDRLLQIVKKCASMECIAFLFLSYWSIPGYSALGHSKKHWRKVSQPKQETYGLNVNTMGMLITKKERIILLTDSKLWSCVQLETLLAGEHQGCIFAPLTTLLKESIHYKGPSKFPKHTYTHAHTHTNTHTYTNTHKAIYKHVHVLILFLLCTVCVIFRTGFPKKMICNNYLGVVA